MGCGVIAVNSFLVVDIFELPKLLLPVISVLFFMLPPRTPMAILKGPYIPAAADMAEGCAFTAPNGSWATFLAPRVSVGITS